jgi:hypothetical protein
VNWLGVSLCCLLKVDGLDLHVEELDAVDVTSVLDIKPWFTEKGPRGEVREPAWPTEMLTDYHAGRCRRWPSRRSSRPGHRRGDQAGRHGTVSVQAHRTLSRICVTTIATAKKP